MIKFINPSQETPYKIFKNKYDEALNANQSIIQAACISSYSSINKEVNARFVNLKFVNEKEFIFFSNYESPKAKDFLSHDQISAVIYWSSTNVQIRIRATIERTSTKFNQEYFKSRLFDKNALAISSHQSKVAESYEEIIIKFKQTKETSDLSKCPNYWGGYTLLPYYFEFWEGHESRINKREAFDKTDDIWKHSFLQP